MDKAKEAEVSKKKAEEEASKKKAEEEARLAAEKEARLAAEKEARLAAEKEFLGQFERQRKLSTERAMRAGYEGGSQSGVSSRDMSESETDWKQVKAKRPRSSPEEKKKRMLKKTRADEIQSDEAEESENEDNTGDALGNISIILAKMRDWWAQPTIGKMVTKPQTARYARYLAMLEEELIRGREERARLEARIEERKEMVKIVVSAVREELGKKNTEEEVRPVPVISYSAALRQESSRVPRVTGIKGPMVQAPKKVFIRHDTKEGKEVEDDLKRLVRPGEIGLKVRRMVQIKNGVIVEAESEEGAEKLVKQDALKEAGLKAVRQSKVKPCIKVFDVSAHLTDAAIKDEVFSRNMGESGMDEEHFKEEFQIRHKYKDVRSSGQRVHIIAECSVQVRNWLRRKERVFVEWSSCRVKDYVDVARCFKCQRFGHVAKHCGHEKPSCSHCAGEHNYKECQSKGQKDKVCCANCKRKKRDNIKHEVGSRTCPAYEKAVKRQNDEIDYGL